MTENNDTRDDRPKTESNDTMNVDLSPDDDHDEGEPAQPAEEPRDDAQSERLAATNTAPANGEPTEDYDAAGEAKRLIKNSDGDTPGERAANAIEQVQQHLKQVSQRLQQVRQRESKTEERIEDLQEARVHVRRAPDDSPIFRSFGGGITVGVAPTDEYGSHEDDDRVPAPDVGMDGHGEMPDEAGVAPADDLVDFTGVYDRDDLVRDIDDTLEAEQGTLAQLREEQGKLSKGIGNAEAILRELNDYLDKASWLSEEDAPAQGGASQRQTQQSGEGLTPQEIAKRRQQGVGVERDTEAAEQHRQQTVERVQRAQQAQSGAPQSGGPHHAGGGRAQQGGGQQPQTPPQQNPPVNQPPNQTVEPDVTDVTPPADENVDAEADADASASGSADSDVDADGDAE